MVLTTLLFLINRYYDTIFTFVRTYSPTALLYPPTRPTFQDDVYHLSYNFDNSILSDPQVLEAIRGTDIDIYTKYVVITGDQNKVGAHLSENGNKVSGYGHEINYDEEYVNLYIFIDKNFVTKEDLAYHLNRGYLGALLTAAEKNKMDRDPGYTPDYNHSSELTHELTVDIYDSGEYFITIK